MDCRVPFWNYRRCKLYFYDILSIYEASVFSASIKSLEWPSCLQSINDIETCLLSRRLVTFSQTLWIREITRQKVSTFSVSSQLVTFPLPRTIPIKTSCCVFVLSTRQIWSLCAQWQLWLLAVSKLLFFKLDDQLYESYKISRLSRCRRRRALMRLKCTVLGSLTDHYIR